MIPLYYWQTNVNLPNSRANANAFATNAAVYVPLALLARLSAAARLSNDARASWLPRTVLQARNALDVSASNALNVLAINCAGSPLKRAML